MSVSGIASSTSVYPKVAHTWFPQLRKDFATFATSLASGDLEGARTAFATLTKDRQNAGQARSGPQTEASSQLSADLAAIDKALQSGNLEGARTALGTLRQDMQRTIATIDKGTNRPTSVGTTIDVAT